MAIISHKVEGVANDVTHYTRIFPVNKKGHAQSELDGQIASALTNAFPAEPSSYALIGTYSSSQTFTAPEDGWYQIEVFGASGNGGAAIYDTYRYLMSQSFIDYYTVASGGGGGSGGYSCSRIKLRKGDTIIVTVGTAGNITKCEFRSSIEEYDSINVKSGAAGGDGVKPSGFGSSYSSHYNLIGGDGGDGGEATGGNISNINGNDGTAGTTGRATSTSSANTTKAAGGSAVNGGNAGGAGGYVTSYSKLTAPKSGKAGFCKIYRGDTNVVAA